MQQDVVPSLRQIHTLLLMAYIISIPFGLMTGMLCLASCIVGIIRKAGMPKFSTDYLQRVVFTEDF